MTQYVRVDVSNVARGEWVTYVSEYDMFVHGTSKDNVELETYRVLEEAYGLRGFVVIWQDV